MIVNKLKWIHQILLKNGIAHTDIKASNIVINGDRNDVKLIDNDNVTPFGTERKVWTPNANITTGKIFGGIVDTTTDDNGF
jgi:serine/threonine protein kinase